MSRSLGEPGLPAISAAYAHALVARQPNSDPALACSEQLIAEVERSDGLLISTPMHNFTVPAVLKQWIDYVLRIGRTFTSTPEGKFGLLADRPALVLVRSGGICTGAAARQPDFLTPYLKQVLAVIGISTVDFIYLEGHAGWHRQKEGCSSGRLQRLAEMHAAGQHPLAEIEALRERVGQAGIEYQVHAAVLSRVVAHRIEQPLAEPLTARVLGRDQIVDIDEAPVHRVFKVTVSRQRDDCTVRAGISRGQQHITLFGLAAHLPHERVGIGQVRAQLAHHVERRPVILVRHGAFQMDLWHHDCSKVTSLLYEPDDVS